jgi:hypothetical protein
LLKLELRTIEAWGVSHVDSAWRERHFTTATKTVTTLVLAGDPAPAELQGVVLQDQVTTGYDLIRGCVAWLALTPVSARAAQSGQAHREPYESSRACRQAVCGT